MGINGPAEDTWGALRQVTQSVPREFEDAGFVAYPAGSSIEVERSGDFYQTFDTIPEFEKFVTKITDEARAAQRES